MLIKTSSPIVFRIITCILMLVIMTSKLLAKDYVPEDYIWHSPSKNSSESMPCGGHDIGMNVWVEDGDLLFYISRSGMFDENNTLLKAGRWRLRLASNPFRDTDGTFSQKLCLNDGAVYVNGDGTEVCLWADVYTSAVFLQIKSARKTDATLFYESWRYKDRQVTEGESQQCSYKWELPEDCITFADSIHANGSVVEFWHKNREQTVFDYTVSREQLEPIKSKLYNPIGGLCFGGRMNAPGFSFTGTQDGVYASTDYRAWLFKAKDIKATTVSIAFSTGNHSKSIPAPKISRKRSAEWWHAYWQRSNIRLANTDTVDQSPTKLALLRGIRNYELFRYMLGCNAYGEWPTKFNGGLFTFDPVYVDTKTPFTPDYRRWGGGTMTAQNQRLVYWHMLKGGDFDMMVSQFDTYLRLLPTAIARTKYYWGHEGASFCEQIENFGLPNPAEYGIHKPGDDIGVERNAWLEYLWDTVLEFCSMIIQSNFYSNMDIGKYEPLIMQSLKFFDEHYQFCASQRGVKTLSDDGKLILFPSSGCETYKMAYNPSSVIAALHTVSNQFLKYLEKTGNSTSDDYRYINNLITRLPKIPLHAIDGDTCIAPAIVWERIQNEETPQLYPIFPWRVYGVGRPRLDIARNTYYKDPHAIKMRNHVGWKQDNIWAACLGLTEEALRLNIKKLANGPYRFPAFWEPGFDWAPDCNRGGSGMIGLQEMLLQENTDGSLLLFPAWPKDIDASFKLHATDGRIVEAQITEGKVTYRVTTKAADK